MENGKVKIWLPCIEAGSGADVFTRRLADALEKKAFSAQISWFPLRYEVLPHLLSRVPPPPGTDIIFTNSWTGFAFKRKALPLVTTLHHAEFGRPNEHLGILQALYRRMLIRPYETLSFDAADRITAVSNYAAASITKPAHARKTRVIHNWVDVEHFRPLEDASDRHPPFRLLFVGKPSRLKGADLLPQIMHQLGNGFHLDVAGRIEQWGTRPLLENMTLLGQLKEPDLIEKYRRCDALLFPSYSEGFGYTALEAMACGKPVITSNASALPEVVENGTTGILCPPGDVNAFADACRALAADPQRASAMGRAGRDRAEREFSEDHLVSRYADLIEELRANGAGRAG